MYSIDKTRINTMVNTRANKIVVLNNIRSNENVGSIFRTADAAGVFKIYLAGYTPAPLDTFGRKNKALAKAALGAEEFVPWEKMQTLRKVISKLKKEKYTIIAVEQDKKSGDVVKNILKPVRTITIRATGAKRTDKCFADPVKYYRDASVIRLLPEMQEACGEEKGQVNQLIENSRFVGMVQSLLGVAEKTITALSRLVIGAGQIYALPQIEQVVERQEAGENVGLLTNGWGNFFLVLNNKGCVSVVDVNRSDRQWRVFAYDLGCDAVWAAEGHFFSRNKTL